MPAVDKIYQKDCSIILNDREKFPDNYVDLIITSPPYADKRASSYGGVPTDKYVKWFLPSLYN